MQDRFPYLLSLMCAIGAVAAWWNYGWGPFAYSMIFGSLLYAAGGLLANSFLAKQVEQPEPTPYAPEYSMGRILMYACFIVFLVSFLRNDFHTASTYYLYYAIPIYVALKYITKKPR